MINPYSVLIIEDHPLISDSYISALKELQTRDKNLIFKDINVVANCDDAYEKIVNASKNKGIDLVFLDIHLPPSKDRKIISGEDLGIKIRELLPESKIFIITMFNDDYRIVNIARSIDPDGFLVKNDLNTEILVKAINDVIYHPPFYSRTVLVSFRKQVANLYMIDEYDRRLLYELSIGTKMIDLPKIIPLSMTILEKRKRQLKDIFNVKNMSDRELILAAKKRGFI